MEQLSIVEPASEVRRLQENLSKDFPHIENARAHARAFREKLETSLSGLTSSDVSIVVFGSLARDEFTEASDVDWTALIDGVADPRHLDTAIQVKQILKSLEGRKSLEEKASLGIWPSATTSFIKLAGRTTPTRTRPKEYYCSSNRARLARELTHTNV